MCVLFAGMHLISWVLARFDARDFRRLSALAHSPELGCTHVDASGVTLWTWRFVQDELVLNTKFAGRVSGSAVACAGFIGMPFARLACAIPDTMFGTLPTNACIGRADGLCPSRLARLNEQTSGAEQLQRAQRREEGARLKCVADEEEAPGALAAATDDTHAPPDLVTIASTALMHAVLVSWCLASRHAAAALCMHAHTSRQQRADASCVYFARAAMKSWCSNARS